jgi:predicted lipid-binding transport protein (Tim44 family)
MATARFKSVVEQCGVPEVYTLWVEPRKDLTFQRALTQQRVMSVHQETVGTRKDYGEIGFTGDLQAQLLIFPKSLKAFAGKRVVGIQYNLLGSGPAAERQEDHRPQKGDAPSRKPLRKIVRFPEQEPIASKAVRQSAGKTAAEPRFDRGGFLRQVRKAMQQLQDGKAVAAYQTLEKLTSA